MKSNKLLCLMFMALCCDLGLLAKKLILPAANLLTDALHIPGGIGTSFSLMFLVIAAVQTDVFGSGVLMGAVQSGLALCFGSVGSMGLLAPLGYLIPGLAIDCVLYLSRRFRLDKMCAIVAANALAAVGASLAANLIVFHLHGVVLGLYLSVSATSGALCGLLAARIAERIKHVIGRKIAYEQ